jgi:hypothetical protein
MGDIYQVLSIYHSCIEKKTISIYVTHEINTYKFLLSLNLDVNAIILFSNNIVFRLKNPYSWTHWRREIRRIYAKYFAQESSNKVYYFSNYHDWLLLSLVAKLTENNTVMFVDYYNIKGPFNDIDNFFTMILGIIYNYVTGIKFKFRKIIGSRLHLFFQSANYSIQQYKSLDVDKNTLSNFLFKIKTESNKSILLIESNEVKNKAIVDYEIKLKKLLTLYKEQDYTIIVKPHPRLGYSSFLKPFIDVLIDDFVPAELVDCRNISAIIGISSLSLARLAKGYPTKTYSLLNFIKFESDEQLSHLKNYICEQSENKISFVSTTQELENSSHS